MPLRDAAPVAFAMVGLPARGKSYIARKLFRYLSWLGHKTKVFNVGSYRRESLGAYQNAAFFDPDNPEGQRLLNDLAMRALDDMIEWFDSGGQVGIYDATNTTRARRKLFVERCRSKGVPVVFIESICDDPRVIDANVRETKLSSPDYLGADPDDAVQDFRERIANYGRVYEPVGDDEGSYIKIIDVGRQVVLNRISGYIPDRILPLLIRMHVTPRPILFTRHGESEFNARGLLGGDPELSPRGVEYSRSLAKFIDERFGDTPITVWTSTLRRTIQTAAALGRKSVAWRTLDEIDGGICDGMTYAEIKEKMPDVHAARSLDKFGYRYPRGESYADVILRVERVIIEMERQRTPVLVIGHQAVLRAVYAYFTDLPAQDCPYLSVPLHTVVELTPTAYGVAEKRHPLEPLIED